MSVPESSGPLGDAPRPPGPLGDARKPPGPLGRIPGPLRVPIRTAGFVGLTFTLLVGFESERLLVRGARDDRARDDVTYAWMARYGRALLRLYGLSVDAHGPHVEIRGGRYPARDGSGRGR